VIWNDQLRHDNTMWRRGVFPGGQPRLAFPMGGASATLHNLWDLLRIRPQGMTDSNEILHSDQTGWGGIITGSITPLPWPTSCD